MLLPSKIFHYLVLMDVLENHHEEAVSKTRQALGNHQEEVNLKAAVSKTHQALENHQEEVNLKAAVSKTHQALENQEEANLALSKTVSKTQQALENHQEEANLAVSKIVVYLLLGHLIGLAGLLYLQCPFWNEQLQSHHAQKEDLEEALLLAVLLMLPFL
jgi:cobalamin biosynthesis Mg chelatase CobN